MEKCKAGLSIESVSLLGRRFRKRGRRLGKKDWRWKEKRIEEVKECKYLGYDAEEWG